MAGAPNADALDALLAEFRGLADSKRMAGNYLEQLARHYLTPAGTATTFSGRSSSRNAVARGISSTDSNG